MPTPFILKLEHGADLSDDDRQVLEQAAREVRHFSPRHDLIREGDRPDYVHVIREGIACRYKVVRDGGRQIMAYLLPGDFCDLHVSLLGEMDHNIGTLTACMVALLPRTAVEDLTTKRAAITRALWWATLVDEGILREWLVNMGRRPADQRLAHLLCELLLRLRCVGLASDTSFELPLTQGQLADTLGMTEVHLNRMVHQLRKAGLITLRDHLVYIGDVERLMVFADFNSNYLHLNKRPGTEPQGDAATNVLRQPD
jgi:CRP-like cAMP-binding protein